MIHSRELRELIERTRHNLLRMKTVFIDVDTQLDFLYPAGALYVPGAERICPRSRTSTATPRAHGIPVVSTTDAHTENDPEFQSWPHALRRRHHRPAQGRSHRSCEAA